jgi:hypothetical protein
MNPRSIPSDPVHYSSWAAQGDIQLACDQSWGEAGWVETPEGLHSDIYALADLRLFTFNEQKITCPGCLAYTAMKHFIAFFVRCSYKSTRRLTPEERQWRNRMQKFLPEGDD